MIFDIENLKDIDWWNDTAVDIGKIKITIEDLAKPYIYDYESKPWDKAYANITNNLFGSFPIAMQVVGDREVVTQKHRLVNISYDPQFPPIPLEPEPEQLHEVPPEPEPIQKRKGKRKGTYGI